MWADAGGDGTSGFAERLDAVLSRHWPDLRGRVVPPMPGRAVLPLDTGPGPLEEAVAVFSRRYPGGDRRAVASLFTQWYLATSWPALVTALLVLGRVPPADAAAIRLDPCGTPTGLAVRGKGRAAGIQTGLERLVRTHAAPLIRDVAAYATMSPRVPWSNAINVLGWTLEQLDGIAAAPCLEEAGAFFTRQHLSDGSSNPFRVHRPPDWRRGGRPPRRMCCLRYRLAGVDYCADCPVPATRRI